MRCIFFGTRLGLLDVSDEIDVCARRILAKKFLLDYITEAVIFGEGKDCVEEGIACSAVPMNNEAGDFKEGHADSLRQVLVGGWTRTAGDACDAGSG